MKPLIRTIIATTNQVPSVTGVKIERTITPMAAHIATVRIPRRNEKSVLVRKTTIVRPPKIVIVRATAWVRTSPPCASW